MVYTLHKDEADRIWRDYSAAESYMYQVIRDVLKQEGPHFYPCIKSIFILAHYFEILKNDCLECLYANFKDELGAEDVCHILDIPYALLEIWRKEKTIPHHKKGRKIFYKRDEVIDHLLKTTVPPGWVLTIMQGHQ